MEEVERVNHFATDGLVPDLTFLLELDPVDAAARAGMLDRFEDEGLGLQRAVARGLRPAGRRGPGALAAHRRRPAPRRAIHDEVLAAVEAARSGARA